MRFTQLVRNEATHGRPHHAVINVLAKIIMIVIVKISCLSPIRKSDTCRTTRKSAETPRLDPRNQGIWDDPTHVAPMLEPFGGGQGAECRSNTPKGEKPCRIMWLIDEQS
ncbi:hypothetical protein BDV59DRAFT_136845 [Aspergillus ambiguus]|uniref:uncharacterized protein n=1 Tax=Aspergillus ambiguus TaxID=176160 RepID=UPI003CCD2EA9